MPLLDHFHPPLKGERHWESFHSSWAAEIAAFLNVAGRLPDRFFAETRTHYGPRIEVDVGTLEEQPNTARANGVTGGAVGVGGVGLLELPTYAPPVPTLAMPAVFPGEYETLIYHDLGGPTLVAAIELVSPGNKDRPDARRAFAAKCAAYLQNGIGLVVIDMVTESRANLHDELIDLHRHPDELRFPLPSSLYAVSYRPARRKAGDQIDVWPFALAVGETLPRVPLALRNYGYVEVDLEETYTETRRRGRYD